MMRPEGVSEIFFGFPAGILLSANVKLLRMGAFESSSQFGTTVA
jgi:hypothetical protein